jgi:V/A-type H+/Na+-transporting ATPase subunit I
VAIAKMTRVFMVGAAVHKEETLRFLQCAGVLHLEPVVPLAGDGEKEVSDALLRLRRIGQVEKAVSNYSRREKPIAVDCPNEALVACAEEILSSLQEIKNRRLALERSAEDLELWGNFDPEALSRLEGNGVHVQRWRMDRRKSAGLDVSDEVFVEVVSEKRGFFFYTVSLEGPIDIPGASSLPLPEMSLAQTREEIERLKAEEETLGDRLAGMARRGDDLKAQLAAALNEAHYLEQMGTLYAEDYLFGLQGWIPADLGAAFLRQIETERLPLQVETRDPLPEEEPPILLKNNWFVERIEPLLRMYGLPKYQDLDPSAFFAPFMIAFFGICLGDAGYGILMYIMAHWLGRKLGDKVEGLPQVVRLCKAFAVAAFIFGILTGSVFGYNFENRRWIMLDVATDVGNPMLFFYLALGMGVLQLSVSYILGMIRARSLQEMLAKMGILTVFWGGVSLVVRTIWFADPARLINAVLFQGGFGLLILGMVLTLLFASSHRNWFVRLGLGLWNMYGMTGLIGDLLSYARLFGLGIATGAIGAVINQLAGMAMEGAGAVFGPVIAVVILVIGHIFNLMLGMLGSTVHSARLHFVEAFKGFFSGGGIAYKPLKNERGSSL